MTACTHFLEFHRPGDLRIGQNAGRFLGAALREGGVAVAIANARSAKGILAQLSRMGHDPVAAMQSKRFMLFESSQMLSRFCGRRGIDKQHFDQTVAAVMRDSKTFAGDRPLHAFGDMVGVLWQREKHDAAVELEKLWIELQDETGFSLFCAYPVDIFSPEFSAASLGGVLETHTHLTPSPASAELGRALDRAMEDVLGEGAERVRFAGGESTRGSWPSMPKLEKLILWLRTHLPESADAILKRARHYYEISAPRQYLREEHSSR